MFSMELDTGGGGGAFEFTDYEYRGGGAYSHFCCIINLFLINSSIYY